jgi:hypothetical protein
VPVADAASAPGKRAASQALRGRAWLRATRREALPQPSGEQGHAAADFAAVCTTSSSRLVPRRTARPKMHRACIYYLAPYGLTYSYTSVKTALYTRYTDVKRVAGDRGRERAKKWRHPLSPDMKVVGCAVRYGNAIAASLPPGHA